MKTLWPLILFIAVILLIDFYAFKGIRLTTLNLSGAMRKSLVSIYWICTLCIYMYVIYAIFDYRRQPLAKDYFHAYTAFGLMLLFFVPKIIIATFHMLDDVINLGRRLVAFMIQKQNPELDNSGTGMSRWNFITNAGIFLAAIPFAGILYGMIQGRFNFRVVRQKINNSKIPKWANGMRIVHISDIHIGSFFGKVEKVLPAIKKINSLDPDLILFTGDMVNNHAHELDGWEAHLGLLKARHGKYAILGNHDYGDYMDWPSEAAKQENLQSLISRLGHMGFKVLLDEMVTLKRNGETPIELIGVQNWGLGGFAKYGNLKKAMQGSDENNYRILMSHDPSHWDAEVSQSTTIELTLSGHTHGMQFGIEAGGIKWSPAQYRYPHWAGLYQNGRQILYVNRGFGYIGFPGRVGISPEITLLELQSEA